MSSKRKQSVQYDEDTNNKVWGNLRNSLYNHEYWATTIPAAWDITAYDMSLLKGSYNNKRMAHAKLKADFDIIVKYFPKQTEIQKSIRLLNESLMKCHRNEENQNFWKDTAIKLNQAAQERDVCSVEFNNSVRNVASTILDKEFRSDNNDLIFKSNTQPSSFPHKKQKVAQEHSTSQPDPSTLDRKSSATIIKLEAEAIHKKLLEGVDITSHEEKIMKNGLSSILDLSDDSPLSQQLFFSADVWNSMKTLYHKKYNIQPIKFPGPVINTWNIVCHLIKKTRSIDSGLKYMYQVYPKHFDDKTVFRPLKALETVLQAMNDQGYLLEKQTAVDVTEYDYLGNIWLPLFRILFQKSDIRIKTHESTFAYTTLCKIDQYPKSTNVIGFKIDIRFLVDRYGQEYDICSGEMAKKDDNDKIMNDRAKVNRESKDDLDCMLNLCEGSEWSGRIAWQFQSAGSTGRLNSIHLVGNGLYVVLGRYEIKFPSSFTNISDLLPLMNDLFTWRESMYEASDFIRDKVTEKHQLHSQASISPSTLHKILQRDTTYSPPEKTTQWHMPSNLYGYVPTNFTEKLLKEFHSSSSPSTSTSSSTPSSSSSTIYENLVYDSNDWAFTGEK